MGNAEVLVPNTIEAYREILQTKFECFVKPRESYTGAVMVIGDGLPWAHGDLHRLRRAALNSQSAYTYPLVKGRPPPRIVAALLTLASELFSPTRMKSCAPRVKAKVEQMVSMLAAKQATPGEAVEGN